MLSIASTPRNAPLTFASIFAVSLSEKWKGKAHRRERPHLEAQPNSSSTRRLGSDMWLPRRPRDYSQGAEGRSSAFLKVYGTMEARILLVDEGSVESAERHVQVQGFSLLLALGTELGHIVWQPGSLEPAKRWAIAVRKIWLAGVVEETCQLGLTIRV
jgi:hypothetical protein